MICGRLFSVRFLFFDAALDVRVLFPDAVLGVPLECIVVAVCFRLIYAGTNSLFICL